MPSPADLAADAEARATAAHEAMFADAKEDVERLFDHFMKRVEGDRRAAAVLVLSAIMATPEEGHND